MSIFQEMLIHRGREDRHGSKYEVDRADLSKMSCTQQPPRLLSVPVPVSGLQGPWTAASSQGERASRWYMGVGIPHPGHARFIQAQRQHTLL